MAGRPLRRWLILGFLGLPLLYSAPPIWSVTLDDVRARGQLGCGVAEAPVFSTAGAEGGWKGLGADFCRAVAAAVLGDGARVAFVPLSPEQGFAALQKGEVDLLSQAPAWTMKNETALGISFAGVIYYDGQGLMVRRKLEVQSALELSGAQVCTAAGTAALDIAEFFRSRGMPYNIVAFETAGRALEAYEAERCDAYSANLPSLSFERQKLPNPADHVILPEKVSQEPVAVAVRQGDPQWASVVRWTLFALIDAEELGVSKDNSASLAAGDASPGVKQLLGAGEDLGKMIGLSRDWALLAIEAVGNYGEIFERNLGSKSTLNIDRGENRLWNKGGILFAPPVR